MWWKKCRLKLLHDKSIYALLSLNNTTQGFYLMLLHVFFLSQHTICSLCGSDQPVTEWNITAAPPPTLHMHNLPHKPSSHIHVLAWQIKNRRPRQRGLLVLWGSHQCRVCVYPAPLDATFSPSLWWTPRWSWSSRLRPSPPPAGTLWCVCRHLSITEGFE